MPAIRGSRATIITVLAGVGIAVGATVHLVRQNSIRPHNQTAWHHTTRTPLRIEARGSRRAWRFSYSGPDGILGTEDDPISDGHLRLPTGENVVIQLRSDDYIYVFSCPELELKEIAIPDLEFSISFQTDRRGEYDLAMDPMCGFRLPPGETMGTLSVVPKSEFRLWLADRR